MAFSYPISLDIAGRKCVVVGGGSIAEHKVAGLLDAGAAVTVVSESFTPELERLAREGGLDLVRRSYAVGDLAGAFLAIAATDDAEVNAQVFAEAQDHNVLMNAVDDVDHCHFAAPSIVRRGDLTVAISTGGKAPALAKRLRQSFAAELPDELGPLVDLLAEAREDALPRAIDFDTWAERWRRALDHDLLGLVRDGRSQEAKEIVANELAGTNPPPRSARRSIASAPVTGHVSIVGAGPGDPDLISVRGRQALDSADVVVYDRLVHPSLLEGKNALFVGKTARAGASDQERINALLVRLARKGKHVVRLKGGDPFVFGRGSEEAETLAAAGIDYEVVPAPTSAIAALAYAGIPVTDRRYSSSVAFVTGHRASGDDVDWPALAQGVDTIVVLMGLGRIDEIARKLIESGRSPHTSAAVVENGTLPDQRVVTAELAELAQEVKRHQIASPALFVIGEVVRLRPRIAWFDQTDGAADSYEEPKQEPAAG